MKAFFWPFLKPGFTAKVTTLLGNHFLEKSEIIFQNSFETGKFSIILVFEISVIVNIFCAPGFLVIRNETYNIVNVCFRTMLRLKINQSYFHTSKIITPA